MGTNLEALDAIRQNPNIRCGPVWVSHGTTESGDALIPIVWFRKPTCEEVEERFRELHPQEYEEVGHVHFLTTEGEWA